MNMLKLLEYYFLIDSEHESLINLFSPSPGISIKDGGRPASLKEQPPMWDFSPD